MASDTVRDVNLGCSSCGCFFNIRYSDSYGPVYRCPFCGNDDGIMGADILEAIIIEESDGAIGKPPDT